MHAKIILWPILLLIFKKTPGTLKIDFLLQPPQSSCQHLMSSPYVPDAVLNTHTLTHLILTQPMREELQLPSFVKSEERKFKQLSVSQSQ